jgi:glycosyltransferase involved in cell wall biosynthesis
MVDFDVLAVPSFKEAFGRSIVEAQALGIAVVASDGGGIPEIIEDGGSGLLVPKADPAALALALERVLTNPALRSALTERARTVAAERFDVRTMTRKIQAILIQTMADDRASR